MAWFARDHTGRYLLRHEQQFVAELAKLLAELALPQVDENETALTAEGTSCLIVLIPHRALGGISIVVRLSEDRAEVSWAQVAGLDCCHDSLDLGVLLAGFPFERDRPDYRPVIAYIRRQSAEPLTLRLFNTSRAVVFVRDWYGTLRKIGSIGAPWWRSRWLRWKRPEKAEVRLSDSTPPPITEPSHVDQWFSSIMNGA